MAENNNSSYEFTSAVSTTISPNLAGDDNASNTSVTDDSNLAGYRSSLQPFNFTFTNVLPSDLYLPDDTDITDATSGLDLYRNLSTTVSSAIDCLANDTSCHNDTGYTRTRVFTDEDLWRENDNFARNVIPAMVFVGILMILGIVGNILVVYVFGFRFKTATQHFLIVCLACFDLLIACIAMPTEIADLRFHHTFSSLFACKLLRFITMFSSISSSFTLVTIAVDRHRRVTRPLTKQMTMKRAKIWELINVLGSLFFSWPLLVMTGLRSSETRVPGLIGTDCSFSDTFHETKYPLVYNAVLGVGFIVLVTVICILYFRIWKTAKGHRVYMANRSRPSSSGTSMCDPQSNGNIVINGSVKRFEEMMDSQKDNNRMSYSHRQSSLDSVANGASSLPVGANDAVCNHIPMTKITTPTPHDTHMLQTDSLSPTRSSSFVNGSIISNGTHSFNQDSSFETDIDAKCPSLISNLSPEPTPFSKRRANSLTQLSNTYSSSAEPSSDSRSTSKKQTCIKSPSSQSPSPVLRSRSLKLQDSYASSIKSDDLRPMSSLLDSVSKYLFKSASFKDGRRSLKGKDSVNLEGADVSPTIHNRVDRLSRGTASESGTSLKSQIETCAPECEHDGLKACNQMADSSTTNKVLNKIVQAPVAISHPCADVNELQKPAFGTGNACSGDEIKDTSGERTCIDKTETASLESQSMGDNLVTYEGRNNGDRHSPCVVADQAHTASPKLEEENCNVPAINTHNNTVTELSEEDISHKSFFDMVNASDFSHLIGERSRPMAIPRNVDTDLVSNTVDKTKEGDRETDTSEKHSAGLSATTRAYSDSNLNAPFSSSILRTPTINFRTNYESDNRISSSASPYNKRRSTVVSVLERYRIRTGSAASLDNITTTSHRSASRRSLRSMDKTTIVAFAITTVFVLSFVPYLTLMFVRSFVKDFDYNLSNASLCVYNIFLRFYFLNSAVNPLLYGWLNERFRNECKRLLTCKGRKKVDM